MSEPTNLNPPERLEDILEKAAQKLRELEEICSNAGVSASTIAESKQSAEASHQNILNLLADIKINQMRSAKYETRQKKNKKSLSLSPIIFKTPKIMLTQ